MSKRVRHASRARAFTEKNFYLGEFRDRTLAIALAPDGPHDVAPIEQVLKELEGNPTDVVLLGSDSELLTRLASASPIAPGEGLEGMVWRGLRMRSRASVQLPEAKEWAAAAAGIALRLGVPKLVCLDPRGGLVRGGQRQSFVGLEELSALLAETAGSEPMPRRSLLAEIERALREGLPAINLCTSRGLSDELFTYAGSGTLFTRKRYVEVRKLSIDDYDAADDLIARGVSEGYLAPRTAAELDRVFANGYGAFVEGRHLAGIAALLPLGDSGVAEIASLYTLTRFVGEGVGGHLVAHLVEHARSAGFGAVLAVTTSDRAASFFQRNGFDAVASDDVPAEKWHGYDPERRARAHCLLHSLRG